MEDEAAQTHDDAVQDAAPPRPSAGETLRAAREEQGIDLAQVVGETRISQRHLLAIENGDYAALPSRTYAIGFTRTYARHLGLDEKPILDDVRRELAEDEGRRVAPARYEPGDPARVPSSRLAWFGGLAALLLLVGGFVFYRTYFAPGLGPAPLTAEAPEADPSPTAAPTRTARAQPSGPVVFTANTDEVWVRFYDAEGERLYETIMNEGDSYTVPSDADAPQIRTGRPYGLDITIGGREVPRLSEEDEVIADVEVTAEALLARGAATAEPSADRSVTGQPPSGSDG